MNSVKQLSRKTGRRKSSSSAFFFLTVIFPFHFFCHLGEVEDSFEHKGRSMSLQAANLVNVSSILSLKLLYCSVHRQHVT